MKILIIEDNKQLAASIRHKLKKFFEIDVAHTGDKGEYLAYANEYDLILLDLNLPDMDGTQVCNKIRESGSSVPILVLTGKTEIADKVQTLDGGVDDYLTKPFAFEELLARMRALLRRKSNHKGLGRRLIINDLFLDLASREVWRSGRALTLRPKEFQLLEYLMSNQGIVVSRSQILEHVWETDIDPITNTVDVHIKKLREKVDKPFSHPLIKTIHGTGYMVKA